MKALVNARVGKAWIFMAAIALLSPAVVAQEELCLDCHFPAEDWEGLSAQEVYEVAIDVEIKRHKDNSTLSEEELRAIIEKLLSEEQAQ